MLLKEFNYDYHEFNASEARSGKEIKDYLEPFNKGNILSFFEGCSDIKKGLTEAMNEATVYNNKISQEKNDEARKAIVDDLEKQNLIEKIDPHTLMVPRGDRTNSIIEPYMTDQWFVIIRY